MTDTKNYKVYLSNEDYNALKKKAIELGLTERGWLSHFFRKIANNDIAFLDNNVKLILNQFRLK